MPPQQQQQPPPPSPYGTPALDPYAPRGRKRSRPRDELQLDLQGLHHALHADEAPQDVQMSALTPHAHHAHYYTPQPAHQQAPTQHHHHRLPNTAPPHKMHRGSYGSDQSPPATSHGPPSVVGQEGMPPPAPRPRGPKLKFTPEDDSLLVELKEKKNLTWKQIAEFFPGRSSGTLQVRYCTKLKAKTTVWTDDMVQKLRNAMQEYENDRWRIISAKVGSGFSPAACRDKAAELSGELPAPEDDPEPMAQETEEGGAGSSFAQEMVSMSSESDPTVAFQ